MPAAKGVIVKRLFRLMPAGLLLLFVGAAASSLAQEAPEARRPARHRWMCLKVVDLTADQRTQVTAILEAARPGLQENLAAVGAARETLRAALEAQPQNACAVGSAAIGVQAALQTLRDTRDAVRAQIAGVLTPEQLARFEGCIDALWPTDLREPDGNDEIVR